jgi:hypothetical protein
VQNPHNLGNITSYSIKHDIPTSGNGSDSWSYFLTCTPGVWVVFDQPGGVADVADKFVCRIAAPARLA